MEDISKLRDFFYATDEIQEVLEVDGVVVTTNQLDDYNNRGDHPLLAPLTLYVYSMWISRVELRPPTAKNRQVVLPFSPSYKLAGGYGQLCTVIERIPKIDGYTMPPPRIGGADTIMDMELNAMFKSVLHRPTAPGCTTETLTRDPLEAYMVYHARPAQEDPSHPWSQNRAFSGSWYAYFTSVQERARKASRKLLARQELETIWETQEMQAILCQMADSPCGIATSEPTSSKALDGRRLTCEEYVAYVTVPVVQNMDAIAWARVNRKTRMPELCQHLPPLNAETSKDPDEKISTMMSTPGLLRKVSFPFKDMRTAFSYAQDVGARSTAFAKDLTEFFKTQKLSLSDEPSQPRSPIYTQKCNTYKQ